MILIEAATGRFERMVSIDVLARSKKGQGRPMECDDRGAETHADQGIEMRPAKPAGSALLSFGTNRIAATLSMPPSSHTFGST